MVCGTGTGAVKAANKVEGARAGLASDTFSAHQGVEHDDLNLITIGSRVNGIEVLREIIKSYRLAEFSGEDRHVRRHNKGFHAKNNTFVFVGCLSPKRLVSFCQNRRFVR